MPSLLPHLGPVVAALAVAVSPIDGWGQLVSLGAGDVGQIDSLSVGGTIGNVSTATWWYGCSVTSAGMLIGYYDRLGYDNLVPGGTAEAFASGAWPAGSLLRTAMASEGHQRDFYGADDGSLNNGGGAGLGYNISGDDVASSRPYDCLADFMGTSQDAFSNPNGQTRFSYYSSGNILGTDFLADMGGSDGATGLWDYIEWRGYSIDNMYTQAVDSFAQTKPGWEGAGFTFDKYAAEIDAGRPVLISLTGHTVLGVGYEEGTQIIEIYDTWDTSLHSFAWGSAYSAHGYELDIILATVMQLAPVPEPATYALLTSLAVLLFARRRRTCAQA